MVRAKTMEEVLAAERPTYIGGGTDIMPLLKNHVRDDRELVFLKDVGELKGICAEDGYLYVGAGETLWDISVSETVKGKWPALAQAAGATASPQIRNVAKKYGSMLDIRYTASLFTVQAALQIPKAVKISRKCLRIVYQNITFSLVIKLSCLVLVAFGVANMWLAVFADVGVMVLAVLNAIRALRVQNL